VVVLSSLFFVYSHVATEPQMNEYFAKSKYDHLLFTFCFVFVSPTEHCSLENFSGPCHVIAADF
jgi:hypothetical protein